MTRSARPPATAAAHARACRNFFPPWRRLALLTIGLALGASAAGGYLLGQRSVATALVRDTGCQARGAVPSSRDEFDDEQARSDVAVPITVVRR